VRVVHKPMIGRWPLFDQTATRARGRFIRSPRRRGRSASAEFQGRSRGRLAS
jgi:hypothetical protein